MVSSEEGQTDSFAKRLRSAEPPAREQLAQVGRDVEALNAASTRIGTAAIGGTRQEVIDAGVDLASKLEELLKGHSITMRDLDMEKYRTRSGYRFPGRAG